MGGEWELAGPVKSNEAEMVELLLNLCGKCASPRRIHDCEQVDNELKSQRRK